MIKKLLLLLLLTYFSFPSSVYSQTGVNTNTPKATLDVNGSLIIRDISEIVALAPDHKILIRDKSDDGDYIIKEADVDLILNHNSGNVNNTIYSASRNGSWQLLNVSLGSNWYPISLTGSADTRVGNPGLFENGTYTAIESGIYSISFELQLESGVNLNLLGGKKVGILKNNTVWEEKFFDAVRIEALITIAAVPITSTNISSLVQLDSGDTLTFTINTGGTLQLNASVLANSKVNLIVYKISD